MSEDQYFPKDSIIKDDIYILFKDSLTCAICSKILREPKMCMKCQKIFCKKCIDNYPNNKEKCPYNCNDPIYKDPATTIGILSKTQYECKNCGNIIFYGDIQSHLNSKCENKLKIEKNLNENKNKKNEEKRLIKIKPEEVENLNNKGKKIDFIKSKKIILINFFLITFIL